MANGAAAVSLRFNTFLHDAVTSLLVCNDAFRCGTVSGVGIVSPVGGGIASGDGIISFWPGGAIGSLAAGPTFALAML